jgi:hypothetical protein
MEFLNGFITEKADEMQKYLAEISEPPKLSEKVQTASNNDIDNEIDFGKELSCLHAYLEENWSEQVTTTFIFQIISILFFRCTRRQPARTKIWKNCVQL